jgi:hypothetical protein
MSRLLAWVLVVSGVCLLPGCAAQQRRDAGTAVAVVGIAAALVGAGVALGCAPFPEDSDYPGDDGASCSEDSSPEPNPDVGLPLFTIGFGTAVLGGIIYGTGAD